MLFRRDQWRENRPDDVGDGLNILRFVLLNIDRHSNINSIRIVLKLPVEAFPVAPVESVQECYCFCC